MLSSSKVDEVSQNSFVSKLADWWMDGWMDGWMDAWMDGWMDGSIDR